MFPLTGERWRELEAVQADVNARVGYRTDLSLYGVEELWTVADRQGDCEDYALAKRRALLARGWPVSALRLAVCTTSSGEGHAVLTVDTDQGVYVLDNRRPFVEPWAALPYTWIKRQSANGPGWVSITS
jgi:predicted transglutaminase-like cysteine proteinase